MKSKFNLALTAIACATMLAACGGGGDPTETNTPPAQDPSAPPIDTSLEQPQLTVPAPTYVNVNRVEAFNRLNSIRQQAGLGLVKQNANLDQASQSHADWQVFNNTMSHNEIYGTQGFTGTTSWNRISASGYSAAVAGEIIAYPRAIDSTEDAIDALSDGIYHRIVVLEPTFIDAGIGVNYDSEPRPVNIKLGVPFGTVGQGIPHNALAVVWPANGATQVNVSMGPENPNPIPEISEYAIGYPASIHCPRNKSLTVTSFSLKNANGTPVDAVLRHWTSDPNNVFQHMKCAAAIVPRDHLVRGTTYKAEFVGAIDGTPIQKIWEFTTASHN